MKANFSTRRVVFISLFAAFISVGAVIAIPVGSGTVPIVLQNMFAVLSGVLLGGFAGFFSTLIWFFAGLIGLPVFSGGRSGIAHILGPTGGFIFGYILSALLAGIIAGRPRSKENASSIVRIIFASIVAFVVLYIPGIFHFMILTKRSLSSTLAACVVPFIPGDIIKCILTIIIAKKLRTSIARYSDE